MNIDVLELGPMENCTYLVSEGKNALLIDPAWDMNFIEHTLKQKGLELLAVFFTHGHFDHVKEADKLLRAYDLKAYIEQNDVTLSGLPAEVLQPYSGEQNLKIGPFNIHIIPTPGHTAGGVCLQIGDALFTGDTLFPSACGRVDLPSSDAREMRKSLLKLSKLPDDTRVFSGHRYGGGCSSNIGYERIANPFMRNAIKDEKVI